MAGYMTEEESMQLWCPHVSGFMIKEGDQTFISSRGHKTPPGHRFKEFPEPGVLTTCIGSKCRHWDWNQAQDRGTCSLENTHVEPGDIPGSYSNIEVYVEAEILNLIGDPAAFQPIPLTRTVHDSVPHNMRIQGNTIVVEQSGFFYLVGNFSIQNGPADSDFFIALRKNGEIESDVVIGGFPSPRHQAVNIAISGLAGDATINDYIEILISCSDVGSVTVTGPVLIWTPGVMYSPLSEVV